MIKADMTNCKSMCVSEIYDKGNERYVDVVLVNLTAIDEEGDTLLATFMTLTDKADDYETFEEVLKVTDKKKGILNQLAKVHEVKISTIDDAHELLGKGFKMRIRLVKKIFMQPHFSSTDHEVIDRITESDLFPKKILFDPFIREFRDYGTGKFLSDEEIREAERNFEFPNYIHKKDIGKYL